MHDFFGCENAMVLDEGYDTFLILNPNTKKKQDDPDRYAYDNSTFLEKIAAFTLWRSNLDNVESQGTPYQLDPDRKGMKSWPLNRERFRSLDQFCEERNINPTEPEKLDIIAVSPNRSQIRAVLILAKRKQHAASSTDGRPDS